MHNQEDKNPRKCLSNCLANQKGQATLEYALTGLIMVSVICGFAILQSKLGEGLFLEHAIKSLSHAVRPDLAGVIGDVLLY